MADWKNAHGAGHDARGDSHRSMILFLAANPAGTSRRALDQECAAIEHELMLTPGRDRFEFRSKWAVTVDELMRHLLDLQPTVVHFSGHGTADGLLLVADDGWAQPVAPAALTRMIQSAASSVRVIVLNACYADTQAEALRDVVGCAIGMRGAITDDAARAFAVGFYRALGHGRSVGNAYEQAEATLAAKGMLAHAQPRCLARRGLDTAQLLLGTVNPHPDPQSVEAGDTSTVPDDPVSVHLQFGLRRHRRAVLVGFRDAAIPIDLERVFVPLHVYADRQRRGSGPSCDDDGELGRGGVELSLDEALARPSDGRTYLALIGDPGAGKSTLLRHLFCVVAGRRTDDLAAHLRGLHPVFVRLSAINTDEQVARGLARIIARVATEDGYPQAGAAVLARHDQRFLFLLDGLDEVRDVATRERICAWLDREVDHWPSSVFVVTSRRTAWEVTPTLGARFLPLAVQGLRNDAIAAYVHRWFLAVMHHFFAAIDPPEVISVRASEQAAALLDVLATPSWRSNTRLLELTSNPLMLSTLCLAFYNDSRLPERRSELYERTLRLLCEVWSRERAGSTVLRLEAARQVLQPVAYAMQDQDRRDLSTDEAVALVRAPLTRVPELQVVAPTAERFLELVRDECGVLTSRDCGRVEFVHLSFQEYLASCHVAGHGLGRSLAEYAGDPRWHEVIMLAVSQPGVFEPFMARALEQRGADPSLLRHCLRETLELRPDLFEVAAERALVRLHVPDGFLTRAGRWLARTPPPIPAAEQLCRVFEVAQGYDLPGVVLHAHSMIDSDVPAVRAAARALVGLRRTHSAEVAPREGQSWVETTTGIAFVWIPDGAFVMGSSLRPDQPGYDPEADRDEEPAHQVRLTGFWMSVYPVTNETYARFIADTGRAAPNSFSDRRFNDPAQPVVSVMWSEARAFTDWLSDRLSGVVAGLPTEAEWEYAARGVDGRRYPWGNDLPDASRATFGQSFATGRPATVGHTPDGRSPFDVHDLAGNVREWCEDTWANSYAKVTADVPDPCHRDGTRDAVRVVRGGSWNVGARGLRAAFRGCFEPMHQDMNLGFRVVCRSAASLDQPLGAATIEVRATPPAITAPVCAIGEPLPAVPVALDSEASRPSPSDAPSTSEVGSSAGAVPVYALYSPRQIVVVTLLCNPFSGAWLLSRNFMRLGQRGRAILSLILGFVALCAINAVFHALPEFRTLLLLFLAPWSAVAILRLVKSTQGKALSDHERQGGKRASHWSAVCAYLVSGVLLVFLGVCVDACQRI